MDLEKWLADWTACVDGIFGERIRFLGIQGSYGRGEATAESDIDVVLLLDGLQLEDLQAYDEAVSALPMREKLCGFVGGWEELIHWDKADLFQFIQDTTPLRGSLDALWCEITKEDIQRAVHKGACDLYHGCVHKALFLWCRQWFICKKAFMGRKERTWSSWQKVWKKKFCPWQKS